MDPQQPPPLQPYVPPEPPPALPPQQPVPSTASFSNPQSFAAEPAPAYPPFPSIGAVPPPITPSPLGQQAPLSSSPPPLSPATPALGVVPPVGGPQQAGSNVREEVIERLRQANNVLVTVSSNPSVDQLSAAIGMTLVLNKLDKHATAVFSGEVPDAISFLQPEKTLEKTTDSLRDFIIALDKSKADKLRYKVEDKFVKIFITPYHTSLSEKDLEFSQGDFNVDVVVALGVHTREELDEAIVAHGRILHDAAVISVNNATSAQLGAINWLDTESSSLSEMMVSLIEPLQGQQAILDSQIATAFLTGVVAETDRFSNDKTSPHTMNTSAILMRAGANQQLVATKLEEAEPKEIDFDKKKIDEIAKEGDPKAAPATTPIKSKDGALQIEHQKQAAAAPPTKSLADLEKEIGKDDDENEGESEGEGEDGLDKIHIDDKGTLRRVEEMKGDDKQNAAAPLAPGATSDSQMILQPPSLGGALSANTKPEQVSPAVDPLVSSDPSTPPTAQVPDIGSLQHGRSITPPSSVAPPLTPLTPLTLTEETSSPQTLEQIEDAVESPHSDGRDTAQQELEQKARQAANLESEITRSGESGREDRSGAMPVELAAPAPAPAAEPPKQDLTSESVFPSQLVHPDTGPPPDPTASSVGTPAPPPELPPPPDSPPPLRMPPTE